MDDGHEQGGDAGGWDGNDEDGANNDGGGCVRDKDDTDCLEEMLQAIGTQIILKSIKNLENLEMVKKQGRRFCTLLNWTM